MQDSILSPNEPFDFPEGDHGVLLIHGWTGCPGHMRLIGEGLHERFIINTEKFMARTEEKLK